MTIETVRVIPHEDGSVSVFIDNTKITVKERQELSINIETQELMFSFTLPGSVFAIIQSED